MVRALARAAVASLATAVVAKFAGTGLNGVKQCIHYETLEQSRSIRPRSKLENLPKKTEARWNNRKFYRKR